MKKQLIASGLLATVVSVFGAAGVTGEFDLPGLNSRIDNLQARTTNNESDIKQLQDSTGTAPAAHVDVPAPVVQTAPAPVAAPASTPAPAGVPAATPEATPVPSAPPVISCVYSNTENHCSPQQ